MPAHPLPAPAQANRPRPHVSRAPAMNRRVNTHGGVDENEQVHTARAMPGVNLSISGRAALQPTDTNMEQVLQRMARLEDLAKAQQGNLVDRGRDSAHCEGGGQQVPSVVDNSDGDRERGGRSGQMSQATRPTPGAQGSADQPVQVEIEDRLAEMERRLAEEQHRNEALQGQLQDMQKDAANPSDSAHAVEEGSVLRPRGSAGQNFSIEMGLATSDKKAGIYKGLQRYLRDLAIRAQLNWELPWAEVAAEDKVKMFRIAREQHPFLKRFRNDWATEEIVKQFFKNKRKNHYRNGWLEVPEKYKHLGDTSSKRSKDGSRVKRAKVVLAAKKAKKRVQSGGGSARVRREQRVAAAEGNGGEDEDEEMEEDE